MHIMTAITTTIIARNLYNCKNMVIRMMEGKIPSSCPFANRIYFTCKSLFFRRIFIIVLAQSILHVNVNASHDYYNVIFIYVNRKWIIIVQFIILINNHLIMNIYDTRHIISKCSGYEGWSGNQIASAVARYAWFIQYRQHTWIMISCNNKSNICTSSHFHTVTLKLCKWVYITNERYA